MSRPLRSSAGAALAAIGLLAASPVAAQTLYSGTGAAATTAASGFAAAIGASTLETFDARPDGQLISSWSYGGGETASLSNGFGVTSTYPFGGGAVSPAKGYGAYPNGRVGGSPVFAFTSAIGAFGAYFVDIETVSSVVFALSGGGSQSYIIPQNGEGGVTFFGADFGANSITGVTFDLGFDEALLIDDVRVATTAVPEPATWALMIAGFGAIGSALRRRPGATVRA